MKRTRVAHHLSRRQPGVIASGIGIGLLLRWVLPSVDLGAGILIGIVSIGLSIHYFLRILALGRCATSRMGKMTTSARRSSFTRKLFPIGT